MEQIIFLLRSLSPSLSTLPFCEKEKLIALDAKMTRPAQPPLPVARFVGSAAVGKKRLVHALLAKTSAKSSSTEAKGDGNDNESSPIADDGSGGGGGNNLDPGSPFPSSSRSSLWTLDTRYYTATLSLERSRIVEEEVRQDSTAAAAAAAEAVVLVFDPSRRETFAAATRWWSSSRPSLSRSPNSDGGEREESDSHQQQHEPAVKLCVAHGEDEEADEDGESSGGCWRAEAEAWCVDNTFELIEVSSSISFSSPPSSEGGGEGIARLRDALAAHAWPGLVRKSPEEIEAARRAAVAEAEAKRRQQQGRKEGGGEGGGGETEVAAAAASGAYAPPPLAALEDGEEEDDLLASPSSLQGACRGAAGIEGLEELFRSLSAARAAASTLPDEERRERAAAMALRLAEALGIEDEDDEKESDSDEEEEERRRQQRREV